MYTFVLSHMYIKLAVCIFCTPTINNWPAAYLYVSICVNIYTSIYVCIYSSCPLAKPKRQFYQ